MAKEDHTSTAIAFVAAGSERLPDAARIVEAASGGQRRGLWARLFGGGGSGAVAGGEHAWSEGNLVFGAHGGNLAVSLMPAPIPWRDLEGPCATAWWWPEATEQMRKHRVHFLVALIGGSMDPVERRVVVTRVLREVIRGTDAIGVFWAEGTLVHKPEEFLQMTEGVSGDKIPGMAWLDVRIEPLKGGGCRCFTTGLAPLGFAEIEVKRSMLEPGELMEFIGDTACYIVNGRKRINDGETMGRTATEKYRVRYGPSMFDRGEVMWLEMQ